jgi:hypothetical protein
MALCPVCSRQFNAYTQIHPNGNGTLCCSAECACCEYPHEKRIAELEAENKKLREESAALASMCQKWVPKMEDLDDQQEE